MQLRVEGTAGVVGECRRANVASNFSVTLKRGILLACSEALEFYECDARGLFVGGPEPFVSAKHREKRDRLLRRTLKIKERYPIGNRLHGEAKIGDLLCGAGTAFLLPECLDCLSKGGLARFLGPRG